MFLKSYYHKILNTVKNGYERRGASFAYTAVKTCYMNILAIKPVRGDKGDCLVASLCVLVAQNGGSTALKQKSTETSGRSCFIVQMEVFNWNAE